MELNELIHDLRARGSDTTAVEAKTASRGLPTSLTPTLSAFANKPGGGLVILGLDEASDFRATGVPDAAAVAAALASRARQAFDPPIRLSVESIDSPCQGRGTTPIPHRSFGRTLRSVH